jgi:hypothetical protein
MNMTTVKKSRATFIGVILAFALPVIGAKLVLSQHWYQGAVTNHGTILIPPIELQDKALSLPQGWRIALYDDGNCSDACMQALFAINQLDIALGKETERVTPVVISNALTELDLAQVPLVQHITHQEFGTAIEFLPPHSLFIVDPLGNIVLYYPTYTDEHAMRMEAKNLMADLRTLLKLSKIG